MTITLATPTQQRRKNIAQLSTGAVMLTQLIQTNPHRIQVVEVIGRVDSNNAVWLTLDVENALAGGRDQVLLDLSGVNYINSAGLRELVHIWKRVQQMGGTLTVVNPSSYVQKVMELVGLDTVIAIYADPTWNVSTQPSVLTSGIQRQTRYYS